MTSRSFRPTQSAHQTDRLVEARMKRWDLRVRILAFAASLGGGCWALVTYLQQAHLRYTEDVESRAQAYRARLYDERRGLYTNACAAAASIAVAGDPAKAPEDLVKFWGLYYGEMCLVEDDGVEAAMVNFGRLLGGSDRAELRQGALRLAHACRASLDLPGLYKIAPQDLKAKDQAQAKELSGRLVP